MENLAGWQGDPDCRSTTITSLSKTIQLGMDFPELRIYTPLMHLTKAQTFDLAFDHGNLHDIILMTHTCYEGNHEKLHEWGYGCGECPACKIRAEGWESWKTMFPTKYNQYLRDNRKV
ncbi:MAG: 7-cyano-7-deazaguanine synthase [Waterburya sp.]